MIDVSKYPNELLIIDNRYHIIGSPNNRYFQYGILINIEYPEDFDKIEAFLVTADYEKTYDSDKHWETFWCDDKIVDYVLLDDGVFLGSNDPDILFQLKLVI